VLARRAGPAESGLGSGGESRKGEALPGVEGYRALAALAVVVYHVAGITGYTSGAAGWGLARLEVGVTVFFLLSGFLLYRPYAAAHLTATTPPRLGSYLKRRVLRIFPAWWLVLAVVAIGFGHLHLDTPWKVAAFASLLHSYDGSLIFSGGLHQAWTLTVELTFYLALPLLAALVARRGGTTAQRWRAQLAAVTLLVVGGVAARAAVLAAWGGSSLWLSSFPTHLALFGLGMGLAVVSAGNEIGAPLSRWATNVAARRAGWCWVAAVACYAVVSTALGLPRQAALVPLSFGQELGRHVLYAGVAFFLLAPGLLAPRAGGVVRRTLRSRPLHALGVISYGIYLWHLDWLFQLEGTGGGRADTAHFLRMLGAVVAVTVVCAAVSYVAVEHPAIRLGRRSPRRVHAG
jgi:peptidoglycan/LPS O-acetylase OafA/YrhL